MHFGECNGGVSVYYSDIYTKNTKKLSLRILLISSLLTPILLIVIPNEPHRIQRRRPLPRHVLYIEPLVHHPYSELGVVDGRGAVALGCLVGDELAEARVPEGGCKVEGEGG